jgi:CMD domain protein
MSEVSTQSRVDLLDSLVGIEADSPLGALRQKRADIASYIQGSYDALLEPEDENGVSRTERGLIALRVAALDKSDLLIKHYRDYLAEQNVPTALVDAAVQPELGDALSPRLRGLLEHVDRLTNEPRAATPEHLAALKAHGLSDANLVTISQLIAFVSFQVRAIVGLQLLGGAK